MTTYTEIETLVVEQTRRPEIATITRAAIQSATLRAHHVDFFPRDLREHALTYTPVSTAVNYDIANIFTVIENLRAFDSVICVDAVTAAPVEQLEYRDLNDLYDSDNVRRQSIYNLLGATLRIYPQRATGALRVCYFANPVITPVAYSSWIADVYPEQLAMWAAAIVFARTGFTEQANGMNELHVKPFKEMLIASHLLGNVN